MHIHRLVPNLAVGPQIGPGDVATLAALGFRSIIGNRPDSESPDQPDFSAIESEARESGLQARHIPVVASALGEQDVDRFRDALRDLPKPIFAFCRTGTRAALLWAMANCEGLSVDERIRIASAHGYDLEAFRERLAQPA